MTEPVITRKKKQAFVVSGGKAVVGAPSKQIAPVKSKAPVSAGKPERKKGTDHLQPRKVRPADNMHRWECAAVLRNVWPKLFKSGDDPRLPLALRIHKTLIATGLVDESVIRKGLLHYVARPKYHAAVAAGGHRYDIHGQPTGVVSKKEQAHAKMKLERILRVQAKRKKAREDLEAPA